MCFDPRTHWWRSLIPIKLQFTTQNRNEKTDQNEDNDAFSNQPFSFSAIAMNLSSWLSRSRPRYLLLILALPFLLPLFCATCPFICALEVCFQIRKRRRKAAVDAGRNGPRRLDESGDEVGLLQRYLEDQLLLVVGSVHQLGDAGEDEPMKAGVDWANVEYLDSWRTRLQ